MGDFLGVTTANVKNNAGAFAKFLNIFWICATKANIRQSFLSTLVVRWSFEEMNAPESQMRKIASAFPRRAIPLPGCLASQASYFAQ